MPVSAGSWRTWARPAPSTALATATRASTAAACAPTAATTEPLARRRDGCGTASQVRASPSINAASSQGHARDHRARDDAVQLVLGLGPLAYESSVSDGDKRE